MINPIKKKTKIHAESMGLVDMANKVDELVKACNKLQAKEEASKGECKQCLAQCRECVECRKNLNLPEHEDRPAKEDDGETWSTWEGFDDRAGTLTRNFGDKGRPANIKDLQEVFISKEKIKSALLGATYIKNPDMISRKRLLNSLGLGD